ncbi:LamG-like jellyroll fold domain-containing protein [Thalassoglobus polymorphus]|uniref:non-specific serine/threonine protein kinase n=1 Tax=Thalassoglobus polymorphus TaxID=2527994 RepID=A0A517QUX2_9PLAN|nr:LamG-like jellyroll fold domain-containing protein [Thalassoglobus polymorphus]QDT35414.1 Serine/threonine-protein kinase StkP [Thalassoglobus polymorphus]
MSEKLPGADEQSVVVNNLIVEYMRRTDSGENIAPEEFIAEHAEYTEELRRHFENVNILKDLQGHSGTERTVAKPTSEPDEIAAQTVLRGTADSETSVTRRYAPGEAPASNISIPEKFGRYSIQKVLGQGAMGAVYLAKDTQLDRDVALKIPKFGDLNQVDEEEMLARFYREARAAATLRSPNICPVYDVGEIDGQHYITMAYIPGRPLKDFTKSKKSHSEKQIATTIRKLAVGLAQAHKIGVVHRDLKPANIMVDKQGEPVVMDFGLARRSSSDDVQVTQSGAILGTPAYMSPEQVEGNQAAIGPQADIYALGIIMYELITGEMPYKGSLMSILQQIGNNNPAKPSELRTNIDPRLENICLKMMAGDLKKRYSSMNEVAADLHDVLRNPSKKQRKDQGRKNGPKPAAISTPHEESNPALISIEQSKPYAEQLRKKKITTTSKTTSKPAGNATPSSPNKNLLIAGGLGGLILLLGIVFIVRIGKYDVQITLDDPSIQLSIDGEEVVIKNGQDIIKLSAGKHQLQLKKAGLTTHVEEFTVTKNGKTALRAVVLHNNQLDGLLNGEQPQREYDKIVKNSPPNVPDGKIPGEKGGPVGPSEEMEPIAPAKESQSSSDNKVSKYGLLFDKPAAYVDMGRLDLDMSKPFTCEFWCTPQTADVHGRRPEFTLCRIGHLSVNGYGDPKQDGIEWQARCDNNTKTSDLNVSYITKITYSAFPLHRQHVAIEWTGRTFEFYINGKRAASGITASNKPNLSVDETLQRVLTLDSPPVKFELGDSRTIDRSFGGIVEQFRISDGQRYNKNFTPEQHFSKEENTTVLYRLDAGSGDVLKDSSGNGQDGKIVGAKWVKDASLMASPVDGDPASIVSWMVQRGGHVRVRDKNGSSALITSLDQPLPRTAFEISEVHLPRTTNNQQFAEYCDVIRKLKLTTHHNIGTLSVQNAAITDEALKHLSGVALSSLDLDGCKVTNEGIKNLALTKGVWEVKLGRTEIRDNVAPLLCSIPKLNSVLLGNNQIGDKCIQELCEFQSDWKAFFLSHTNVTDASLKAMSGQSNLISLHLTGTLVTNEGLASLSNVPKLSHLELAQTAVSDGLLSRLPNKLGLKRLNLIRTELSEKGLRELGECPNLTWLELDGRGVYPETIQHILKLRELETLYMKASQVEIDDVSKLQNLPKLKFLNLEKIPNLNRSDLDLLRKRLPKCKIASDYGTFEPLGGFESNATNNMVVPTETRGSHVPPGNSFTEKSALVFDGQDDYVELHLSDSLKDRLSTEKPVTVEAWVWFANKSEERQYLFNSGVSTRLEIFRAGGGMPKKHLAHTWIANRINHEGAWDSVSSPVITPTGQWTHLAVVWQTGTNGYKSTIYVNGNSLGLKRDHSVNLKQTPRELQAVLGATPSWNGHGMQHYFEGKIRDFRISDEARYQGDFNPEQNLVADEQTALLFKMNEGSGDTLKDSSGNGHHGKIIGAKWVRNDETKAKQSSKPLTALVFNGTTSRVEVPGLKLSGSPPLTIECWVTPSEKGTSNAIIFHDGVSDPLTLQVGGIRRWEFGGWWSEANKRLEVFGPKIEDWERRTHLAGQWNGQSIQLFIDGKLVQQRDYSGSFNPQGSLEIGGHDGSRFKGSIDEIRISKTLRYETDFTPQNELTSDEYTLALYHFDEGAGDVLKDSSDNGNDGKIFGAKWVGGAEHRPVSRTGLDFDGEGDWVKIPTLQFDGSHSITLESYVTLHRAVGTSSIVSSQNGGGIGITTMGGDSAGIVLAQAPSKSRAMYEQPIPIGKRLHLAGTWDQKQLKFFVDGKLVSTADAPRGQFLNGVPHFALGAYPAGRDGFLDGIIDEVRISRDVRYTEDFTPAPRLEKEAQTLALYHFDERAGSTLNDSSGNGHNGEIIGAKWSKFEE